MKYIILVAFLFGCTVATDDVETKTIDAEKISEVTQPIVDIFDSIFNTTEVSATIDAITNIFTGDKDDDDKFGLTAVITAVSAIKTLFLGALAAPLQLANGVLALVGLVLLIVFLVEGGDFLSLIGFSDADLPTFRSMSNGVSIKDVVSHPMVSRIADVVYNAIDKEY